MKILKLFPPALVLAFLTILPASLLPAPTAAEESFSVDRPRAPRENYLSLFFGSPPPMATERGILLIDAFLDGNDNGRRDPGENDLAGEVSCSLDGIDYAVPAFIPGLKYEGNYQLACASPRFGLDLKTPELFIAQRGLILRVDIPCRVLDPVVRPPAAPPTSPISRQPDE